MDLRTEKNPFETNFELQFELYFATPIHIKVHPGGT